MWVLVIPSFEILRISYPILVPIPVGSMLAVLTLVIRVLISEIWLFPGHVFIHVVRPTFVVVKGGVEVGLRPDTGRCGVSMEEVALFSFFAGAVLGEEIARFINFCHF